MDPSALPPALHQDLSVVIVGHVDHGKSTLVGRLLHETGSLPAAKLEAVTEACRKRGVAFEWAFVTDALRAERDQGVTIDAGHIRLKTGERHYLLVDAPGHREFIANMVTGAAGCDAALVVIDAAEGVQEQSRRHAYLLSLLGLRQIAVAVTKMDMVGYDRDRFQRVADEIASAFGRLSLDVGAIIPASGRDGANVTARHPATGWYDGPTVIGAFEGWQRRGASAGHPLRIPVQDVYRFDHRRIVAGRVESGIVGIGDRLLVSPSNKQVTVRSLEGWSVARPITEARAGQPVGIVLEEPVFIERGEILSHLTDTPIETDVFRARLFWLRDEPLTEGQKLRLMLGPHETSAEVQSIECVIDPATLEESDGKSVPRDGAADAVIRVRGLMALDRAEDNPWTGRFVLADDGGIVGGGLVSMEGYPDQRSLVTQKSTNVSLTEYRVTDEMRAARNAHSGGVLWFTGLSGAGKSTLAVELERRLFQRGYQVFVLDGDNLRHGLNANLGFSPEDRAENIRRAGEVGALFAKAGFVVITAFISPYRADRARARGSAGGYPFHEVFVKADLSVCESRDPKGLYQRARRGEIQDFTGVSAPYEPPASCELTIDTSGAGVDECLELLLDHVARHFPLRGR